MGVPNRTTPESVKNEFYDAVIVGSGIAGAIIAYELSRAGHRVLVLEAGPDEDRTFSSYQEYLYRFFATPSKDNQSPYPQSLNAPMPRSTDARRIWPGQPDATGYIVQSGPYATDTTYTRVYGGTTMHWEAKVFRMLPEDFCMRKLYGQGENWPVSYDELDPYYREAEFELGVSGDVEEQRQLNVPFPDGYVFPMQKLPHSYLDKMVAEGIDGTTVSLDGERYALKVRTFPQARNGVPNPKYNGGKGYVPVGAASTSQVEVGGRCQGNNNCVPICPVQAKYHAGKTMAKALQTGRVDLLARTVASRVCIDPASGRVKEIEFKTYRDATSPDFQTGTARGHLFILAANAIENPRLMLASGLQTENGLVGRNLMDHAYLLSWALMPKLCGTMRGTNCTGGIMDLRSGSFRCRQAAFSVDIHNDGWGWATGAPVTDLTLLVDSDNKFGRTLRRDIAERVSRQLQLAFMVEVPPSQSNRVSVDSTYRDQLGNMRPVISYSIPEYSMRGVAYARQFARLIFQRLGASDFTYYDPTDFGYVTYEGEGYVIRGGNHLAGTHAMGTGRADSVVNRDQRSWQHENLYLVGGGSMPTIATSNVTLTIAALCFRSAKAMLAQLRDKTYSMDHLPIGEEHVLAHD